MKAIFILLLFNLVISYNNQKAAAYAKRYCRNFNPKYNSYAHKGPNCDCANFVSQCLKEGGFDFSGCSTRDELGMVYSSTALRSCLDKKGWKKTKTPTRSFKEGYPIFNYDDPILHAMIASSVYGKEILFCDHKIVGRCNLPLQDTSNKFEYYFLSL